MATKSVTVTGLGYWAKLSEDKLDMGYQDAWKDKGGCTVIDVDLTKEEYDRLKKAGSALRGKPSPDNDGRLRVKLRRPWIGPSFNKEKLGGLPRVVDEEGKPFDELIGNGSIVEVTASVYTTQGGAGINGTRMDKVKVVDLVTFTPEDAEEDFEENTSEKTSTKEIDDEIPF